MTFLLRIDRARWQAGIDAVLAEQDDPSSGGRVVPVAKSNGYGLGQARVAREMRRRGRDVLSVGTVYEAVDARLDWDADLLVLTPWNVAEQAAEQAWARARHDYGTRLITTVADSASLHALAVAARPERPTRVLIEGLTSVRRFGFSEPELIAELREPAVVAALRTGALRLAGLALHLPISAPDLPRTDAIRHLHDGAVGPVVPGSGKVVQAANWAQLWLAKMAELSAAAGPEADFSAAAQIWVSHLSAAELRALRGLLPDTPVHPRIGTALWLGDQQALRTVGVVLAVHPSAPGGAGYFQRRVPPGAHLLIVGGGTSHGVALSGPIGAATIRRRLTTAGTGLLDAAGRAMSPFTWQGRRLWFLEAPHASVSLVLVGKGVAPPSVGEELPCQIRQTTATFDQVVGLD